MRVVVVGTGVMGLAATRTLAERGHDILAVDRYGVGNPYASSCGESRIWRLAHPDRVRVRQARQAIEQWRDLERRSGESLLLDNGMLWRGGEADAVADALAAEGVEFEILDEARQRTIFPEFAWRDELTVWQPEAGTIRADRALACTARLAVQAGAEIVDGVTVTSVAQRVGGGVTVTTEAGVHEADAAVVTPGPWAATLLAPLGIEVPLDAVVSQVAFIAADSGSYRSRPCFVDVPPEGGSFGVYALPAPGVGYKIAVDEETKKFDPDSEDRSIDPERDEVNLARARELLPGFDSTLVRSQVCTWTTSPDDLFILDRVGDVVVGFGDSGQGFKFHPWFGPVLADLVDDRPGDADLQTYRLGRFS